MKHFFILELENQSGLEFKEFCDAVGVCSVEPLKVLFLKEPNGFGFAEEELEVIVMGKKALYNFKKGDLLAVSLKFSRINEDGHSVNKCFLDDVKLVHNLNVHVNEF